MKSDNTAFTYIGNNLAIDFLNTRIFDRDEEIELLNSPQEFYSWVNGAGLSIDDDIKSQDLSIILEFREALSHVFTATLNDRAIPSKALDIINKHLINHGVEQKLKRVQGRLEIHSVNTKMSQEQLLGHIANEAALLLVSNKLEKLKKCANPKCILLFIDTSKSGKRRWCSMDVCGNRAKAASHYLNSKH